MGLQLNRALGEHGVRHEAVGLLFRLLVSGGGTGLYIGDVTGLLVGEEVFQHAIVHHGFTVEDDGNALTDHGDLHAVPFAEGLVHLLGRILARRALAVVPEAAGALVLAQPARIAFGAVPNLHLRYAAQVHPAVALGQRLVLEQQLEIAVVLVGGGIKAVAIIDQFAILHFPVGIDVFRSLLAFWEAAFDGLFLVIGQFSRGHLPQFRGVLGAPAIPAGQVFAIEQGGEAGGRNILLGEGRQGRQRQHRKEVMQFHGDRGGTNVRPHGHSFWPIVGPSVYGLIGVSF